MKRWIYEDDHRAFRETVREFVRREVAPNYDAWEENGIVERAAWNAAGAAGILGLAIPSEYGGNGTDDFRFNMVLDEELARGGYASLANGFNVHDNIVAPYIVELGDSEQRQRWLPGMADGTCIGAIAMSEPDAGSDLQGMRTSAVRNGDSWVINGAKTFISNGVHADIFVVAARTDHKAGSRGFTLFLVERGTDGFATSRKLDKLGIVSQDTAELSFVDVVIPASAVLGDEGQGLFHLFDRLPRERLGIASMATAAIRSYYEWAATYAFERQAFGKSIGDFQHTRFVLAELATQADVAESFLDRCATAFNLGELSAEDAAEAKYHLTELQQVIVSQCLQLFGGYGYMSEFPISRAFRDARVTTIYGGTSEVMREIIGRDVAKKFRSA